MKYVGLLILGFALGFAFNEFTVTQKTETQYIKHEYSISVEEQKCEGAGGKFTLDSRPIEDSWDYQYIPKCTKTITP